MGDGSVKRISIHKAVLESFGINKPSDEYQVDHIDGNKGNNNITNLEWVTPSENIKRAFSLGLKKPKVGSNHKYAVYSENQVHTACKLLVEGYNVSTASIKSGIPKSYLYNIIKGNNWRHVTSQYDLTRINMKEKMTSVIGKDIEYYLGLGYKKSEIIKIIDRKYSINSRNLVYNYNRGKNN